MSRTIKHPITKSCFTDLEHERKKRKQQRAQDIEFLNASLDLNVEDSPEHLQRLIDYILRNSDGRTNSRTVE